MVFRGCVQATENRAQSDQQVDVASTPGNGSEVIQQDHEGSEDEQREHQHGNPGRTLLHVLGNRGCIATRSRDAVLIGFHLARAGSLGTSSLRGRSSA